MQNDICIIKFVVGSNQTLALHCSYLIKSFLNSKINVRTGFLDPESMGKDTNIDFVSQILRKLLGIEYLAHLAQMAILFFTYMTEQLLMGAGVALF